MGKTLALPDTTPPVAEQYEVSRLEGEALLHHWPAISDELRRVPHIWDTWWTLESLLEAALKSESQVWAVGTKTQFHFVGISVICLFPANRILRGLVGFGNSMEACLPVLIATMQRYAAVTGCTRLEMVGRKGWERVLAPYGFKPAGVVLSAPVLDGRMH